MNIMVTFADDFHKLERQARNHLFLNYENFNLRHQRIRIIVIIKFNKFLGVVLK